MRSASARTFSDNNFGQINNSSLVIIILVRMIQNLNVSVKEYFMDQTNEEIRDADKIHNDVFLCAFNMNASSVEE